MTEKRFDEALHDLESGRGPAEGEAERGGETGTADSHPSVAALRSVFGDAILHHSVMAGDEHVVHVPADRLIEILTFLKDDAAQRYDYLADLTAVDWGGGRPIEMVYQLWSIPHKRALRVKTALRLETLVIASVTGLWNAANWLEREVWDMFGVRFEGHPDHRRILMPENYAEGYPLRKDFPLRGRFSRAEQTRRALEIPVEMTYSPEELEVVEEVRRHVAADEAEPPDDEVALQE